MEIEGGAHSRKVFYAKFHEKSSGTFSFLFFFARLKRTSSFLVVVCIQILELTRGAMAYCLQNTADNMIPDKFFWSLAMEQAPFSYLLKNEIIMVV